MTVNLSIKNVPDDLADKLRHRTLKNYPFAARIIDGHFGRSSLQKEVLTPSQLLIEARKMKLQTESDSAHWVRGIVMPPIKIVDASALGAFVFGEPEAEEVSTAISNSSMVAPLLLWF
ncbi:MAG: hypothetical protein U5R30_04780 [Deltaproteobacteria bacterium]|nr:hypothetical protein [Deltaproteobacteria bacterium]